MDKVTYSAGEPIGIQEQSVIKTAIENMDNGTIAKFIDEKLGYEFTQFLLIKPLELEKVTKTLTVPEDSGEKDENGDVIMQMTIKQIETESRLRKGIVIALPASLTGTEGKISGLTIKPGDTVVYPNTKAIDFDLYKDSALIQPYEVIAVVR